MKREVAVEVHDVVYGEGRYYKRRQLRSGRTSGCGTFLVALVFALILVSLVSSIMGSTTITGQNIDQTTGVTSPPTSEDMGRSEGVLDGILLIVIIVGVGILWALFA